MIAASGTRTARTARMGAWRKNTEDVGTVAIYLTPRVMSLLFPRRLSLVLQRVEPPPEKCMGLLAPSPGQVNDLHPAEIA